MASEGWFSWSATTEPQYSDDEFEPGIVLDPRALRGVPTKLASADRSTEMDDVLATLRELGAADVPREAVLAALSSLPSVDAAVWHLFEDRRGVRDDGEPEVVAMEGDAVDRAHERARRRGEEIEL